MINGIPQDGDEEDGSDRRWEAKFYSNIDPLELGDDADSVRPYGIAGAFTAAYTDVGKMVGAFGAHAPQ